MKSVGLVGALLWLVSLVSSSIIGANDQQNAICLNTSPLDPNSFLQSHTVARVDPLVCTGWLLCDHYFITNHHCMPGLDPWANTYRFNYYETTCAGTTLIGDVYWPPGGATVIASSAALDYVLLRFDPVHGNPCDTFGCNKFAIAGFGAELEQQVYIAGHPAGRPREVGYQSDLLGDFGFCRVKNLNEPACGYGGGTDDAIGFSCDMEGGSSGSPLIRLTPGSPGDRRVVALNHCHGPPWSTWNRGVEIGLIRDQLSGLGLLENCFVLNSGPGAFCWGDPHFRSFDGKTFDYQGVGTFNFVTSPYNSFILQTRFLSATIWQGASVTRSLAMKKGSNFYSLAVNSAITSLELRFNCERSKSWPIPFNGVVEEDISIGTATVSIRHGSDPSILLVYFLFASGETIKVLTKTHSNDAWMKIEPFLPPSYVGRTQGLMGPWNEDMTDDFTTRSGSITADPYVFGDSWRINARDTDAFTCKPATKDPFYDPNHKPRKDLNGIDPALIRQAEAECRGVPFQPQCVFDVALGLAAGIDPKVFLEDEVYKKECPNRCSGHGICQDGRCICLKGFQGNDCSAPLCPDNCNGNGKCINGFCKCNYGWTGPTCKIPKLCKIPILKEISIPKLNARIDTDRTLFLNVTLDFVKEGATYVIDFVPFEGEIDEPGPCENRRTENLEMIGLKKHRDFSTLWESPYDAEAREALGTAMYWTYPPTSKYWSVSPLGCNQVVYQGTFSPRTSLKDCALRDTGKGLEGTLYVTLIQANDKQDRKAGYKIVNSWKLEISPSSLHIDSTSVRSGASSLSLGVGLVACLALLALFLN